MRKWSVLFLFLLFVTSFCISEKMTYAVKKLEKKEPRSLYVQQGKSYKLSKILSDINDPDEDDTLKNCLKGKKVKWSVKKSQIKLTKKMVTVKKQGEFKLTGVTKKYKYVITLVSIPEKWPAVPEEITSASIMRNYDGKRVEVRDVKMVEYLCRLFNVADYRFDYQQTNWRTVGWTYRIYFYTADGALKRDFIMIGADVHEGRYWYKPSLDDIYYKVSEVYNNLLVEQNPASTW